MSRGLGALQRRILAVLEDTDRPYLSAPDLVVRLAGARTRARDVAVGRALHGLAARGMVRLSTASLRRTANHASASVLVAWLPTGRGPSNPDGSPDIHAPRKRCSP